MRPPKPRYTHMWDVHLVTKYRVCPGITKLLHLSCSQSNWQCLLPFPARNKLHPSQGLSFSSLSCLVSPDQLPQAFFASFPHNKRLCLVGTLRHFLKGTQNLRPVFPSSKPDPLFVSYVKLHNPITAPTFSRWLRMVLTLTFLTLTFLRPTQFVVPQQRQL